MKLLRIDAFGLGIFFLIIAIFFSPTLTRGKLPVPSDALVGLYHPWRDTLAAEFPRGMPFKNFLITDPIRQQIPWRKIAIDGWKEGAIPRWNPYSFSGTPLAANIQSGVYYPLNILFFIFDFPLAWTILIILQPILGGTFLYVFLRSLKIDIVASVLGAVIWSLGGFSTAWLTWGTIGHVALWLPLMLLAIDQSKIGLLAVGFVMAFFAGHTQVFLYIVFLCVLYAWWQKKISLKFFLSALLISLFITSVQWLPLVKFFDLTSRFDDISGWQKAGWFLPWKHLVQFLVPDFFGNPTTLNYWGEWNYGEFIGYIGIVSLIFSGYALLVRVVMWKFWTGVLGMSLLFMLPNFVSKLPYQLHLPVISVLQPTRLMVLVDFCLAILASLGMHTLLQNSKKSVLRAVLSVGIVLGLLWVIVYFGQNPNLVITKRNLILPSILYLAGSIFIVLSQKISKARYAYAFGLCILGIVSFDLIRFGWKFTPFTELKYFFPTSSVIQFLINEPKPYRIMSLDDRLFPPNSLSYYGIESIDGYDPLYNGAYEEYITASERNTSDITPPYGFNRIINPHNIDSPLIPLLNVRYIASLTDIDRPFLRKIVQEGETRVYEDSRAFPRVYFTEDVFVESNRQYILNKLFDTSFNPIKTALVEKQIDILNAPISSGEYITIQEYSGNTIRLEVNAENIRFLVISNVYDPDWEVTIDGKREEIYRTNYIMQGLVVPSGLHTIILRYKG